MFKKLLFAFAASAMLLTGCGNGSGSKEDVDGVFVFKLQRDDTYSVYDHVKNFNKKHIDIPSEHNGKPVTKVDSYAFSECTTLESVNIPESVTAIGYHAFSDCPSLTSVSIPDSIISVGGGAFLNCDNLQLNQYDNAYYLGNTEKPYLYLIKSISQEITECKIDDSCKVIGDSAFYSCASLASVSFGNSVVSINYKAFHFCSSLTSVVLPDSVTTIEGDAFSHCLRLTSISIPDGIVYAEYGAFEHSGIEFNEYNNANYLGNANNPYVLLVRATSFEIATCDINEKCKVIGAMAFTSCGSLNSVTIPESVTRINLGAFSFCSSLKSISIPKTGITYIGEDAFSYCSSLVSINIPESVTTIEAGTFRECKSLTAIIIPSSVVFIGRYAFHACSSLKWIFIPKTVTYIGDYAFIDCSSVTIYCEAESQPSGWQPKWNRDDRPVVWGYKIDNNENHIEVKR